MKNIKMNLFSNFLIYYLINRDMYKHINKKFILINILKIKIAINDSAALFNIDILKNLLEFDDYKILFLQNPQ